MRIFDAATAVMKQGGKRRGANMGILSADHPDIVEFISAKADLTTLSNFNISVGVTDDFMERAAKQQDWPLINPHTNKKVRTMGAHTLFELIVTNAWRTGDPGLIFLDEINRRNPTPHLGRLEATNPCGELPLLPYESCNLGSINLAKMVRGGRIDWDRLAEVTALGVRFLDNVVEANRFPLPEIEAITHGNRKVGLGVMGFADALIQLGIPYDSEEAVDIGERIAAFIFDHAVKASEDLAVKRGAFPNFHDSVYDMTGVPPRRNATVVSIAPTGTISIIAGCSSGIEPLFALAYLRNVMGGVKLLEVNPYFEQALRDRGLHSAELMRKVAEAGSIRGLAELPEDMRRVYVTDFDIRPEWHVRMQAAFQRHCDNAVSKTVNLPADTSVEEVRRIYLLAHELKCKGITVYRYGSRPEQVLTRVEDTTRFELEGQGLLSAEAEYAGGCPGAICPA